MKRAFGMPRPRYDPVNRYDAILRAGEILLCEGYDSAQPQLIAKMAGVSVGLFYRHFKNKQRLLTTIMAHHLNALHAQIAQDIQQCTYPIDALQCVLVSTLRYFRTHQGLIKLFFMEIGYGDAEATQHLKGARQTYRNLLMSVLLDGIAKEVFLDQKTLDVQIAVNSIVGTINWSLYDLLVVHNEDIEPEELAQRLLSYFLRSLARPGS